MITIYIRPSFTKKCPNGSTQFLKRFLCFELFVKILIILTLEKSLPLMQNASSPPSRYTWDHGGSSCDPASIGNVTTVIKRRSLNSIIIIPRFSTLLLLLRSLSLSLSLSSLLFSSRGLHRNRD